MKTLSTPSSEHRLTHAKERLPVAAGARLPPTALYVLEEGELRVAWDESDERLVSAPGSVVGYPERVPGDARPASAIVAMRPSVVIATDEDVYRKAALVRALLPPRGGARDGLVCAVADAARFVALPQGSGFPPASTGGHRVAFGVCEGEVFDRARHRVLRRGDVVQVDQSTPPYLVPVVRSREVHALAVVLPPAAMLALSASKAQARPGRVVARSEEGAPPPPLARSAEEGVWDFFTADSSSTSTPPSRPPLARAMTEHDAGPGARRHGVHGSTSRGAPATTTTTTTTTPARAQRAMSDFYDAGELGRGVFGQVSRVRESSSLSSASASFALKRVLDPSDARQRDSIARELRALQRAGPHPFIVALLAVVEVETAAAPALLLEYLPGGQLLDVMVERGDSLGPHGHRFYVACVASALAHVHARGVLYRDLKPENVLLDALGIPRLVDFGLAREVGDAGNDAASFRARTLCGTPEYLSPEMVSGAGYSFPSDCWALGVLAFELANGYTPFNAYGLTSVADDGGLDPALCRRICNDPVRARKTWRDAPLVDLVLRLLDKDPAARLSAGGAREHACLEGFDEAAILSGAVAPPFRPRAGGGARGDATGDGESMEVG